MSQIYFFRTLRVLIRQPATPMRYELYVDIDCPAADVLEIMMNPDNIKCWQRGFISLTPIKGTAGQEGAKSLLKYKIGNRDVEMTETITKLDLPRELHLTYQTNGVFNVQENYFYETDQGTRWTTVSEFKFNSIFMKIMGFLMPGAFKKQSLRYMHDFKNYMESGVSVADEKS